MARKPDNVVRLFLWRKVIKINKPRDPVYTHEGGKASHVSPLETLKRTVLSCLLWEKTFYEDGVSVADRIKLLVPQCYSQDVADLAIKAREDMKLRHVPLLLMRELARHSGIKGNPQVVSVALARVIQRADELTEFVAIYWKDGKEPLSKQVKLGLAEAFSKFNAYQLAKYNRDGAVKLRDVLFMCHAIPKDDEQAAIWKQLVDGTLAAPDTWEVGLSGGEDKKETFTRLLLENKLGYMALLRNLRNMKEADVELNLIYGALRKGAHRSRALPFRFLSAARAVPQMEPVLDEAMQLSLADMPKLEGTTVLMVDVSASMGMALSSRSDLSRRDAAAALAVLLRGVCDDVFICTFSMRLAPVPPRQGMALVDAITSSQPNSGTYLRKSMEDLKNHLKGQHIDRTIVITDEQSADGSDTPLGKGYMLNVASHENGIGYGQWTHVHGFSEAVVQYIIESEK